jgi:hypothetical protein
MSQRSLVGSRFETRWVLAASRPIGSRRWSATIACSSSSIAASRDCCSRRWSLTCLISKFARASPRASRFESPQLHQEVRANRPGFPAPTIPRLLNALARKLMVCAVYSAGMTGLGRRMQKWSLRRRILGSRLRGWTDQRDREPFVFAVSVRRAPLAPTPTIGQATPLEGPSGV